MEALKCSWGVEIAIITEL